MHLVHLFILFLVGAIAGFINVNAGGGSSLTLPMLIFLGLEGSLANGTNRVAIFIQNIFAVSSFRRQGVHEFRKSFTLGLLTLPGAVIGAMVASRISDLLFQRILAVVLILIVISMLFSRSYQNNPLKKDRPAHPFLYPALVAVGFYGGFLQIGVGFLLMATLYHLLRVDLIRVNMHKVFIILLYTLPALIVFSLTGNVNWGYGLILAAGNALGAWWGARAAVKGGERVIKLILAVAILIMSFKLLKVF